MTKHALLFVALAVLPAHAVAGGPKHASGADRGAAVAKAFTWLDRHLTKIPDNQGTPRKPFTYATAGLDYLLSGAPGETRTGSDPIPAVKDCLLRYLEEVKKRVQDPEQLPDAYGVADSRKLGQYTWPLAQAGFFFTELALRGRYRAESRRAIRRIVDVLDLSRESNGGWGHGRINPHPKKEDPDDPFGGRFKNVGGGYPATLLAATNTVAGALGIIERVFGPGEVNGLDEVRAYYRAARLTNGSFPYDPSQRSASGEGTGVSRTGGALFAMYWLGFPTKGEEFRGSLEFLLDRLPYAAEGHGSPMLNLFQTAIALHAVGGEPWKRFEEEFFPRLIAHQTEEGDLTCICEKKAFGTTCDSDTLLSGGFFADGQKAYVTSLALFVLLLHDRQPKAFEKTPTPHPRSVPTERSDHPR